MKDINKNSLDLKHRVIGSVEDLVNIKEELNTLENIQESITTPTSREEIFDYIQNRLCCSPDCLYFSRCPYMTNYSPEKVNLGKIIPCSVRRSSSIFISWYNICLGGREGIENEMKKSLLNVYESGDTKLYIDQSVKVLSALYGPDKGKRNDTPDVTLIVKEANDI